jgi:hypothetical protein
MNLLVIYDLLYPPTLQQGICAIIYLLYYAINASGGFQFLASNSSIIYMYVYIYIIRDAS